MCLCVCVSRCVCVCGCVCVCVCLCSRRGCKTLFSMFELWHHTGTEKTQRWQPVYDFSQGNVHTHTHGWTHTRTHRNTFHPCLLDVSLGWLAGCSLAHLSWEGSREESVCSEVTDVLPPNATISLTAFSTLHVWCCKSITHTRTHNTINVLYTLRTHISPSTHTSSNMSMFLEDSRAFPCLLPSLVDWRNSLARKRGLPAKVGFLPESEHHWAELTHPWWRHCWCFQVPKGVPVRGQQPLSHDEFFIAEGWIPSYTHTSAHTLMYTHTGTHTRTQTHTCTDKRTYTHICS